MKNIILFCFFIILIIENVWAGTQDLGGGGNASQIQGRLISIAAPTNGQALLWDSSASQWAPATVSSLTYSVNQYGVALSSSTNATLTILTPDSSTSKYLKSGGSSANPSWGLIDLASSVSGILPAANGGATSPGDIINCSLGVTVAASAITITLLDYAGNALSATSPCIISFRSATTASGIYAQRTTTSAVSVVGSNGSSLGCPAAAVGCMLDVYAVDSGSGVVLGVQVGYPLDEGSVQTGTALAGSGADDAQNTLWTTATQTSKPIRFLSRVRITPAAAFAWTNAVTEISSYTAGTSQKWVLNSTQYGVNPSLSASNQATLVDIPLTGLTSAPAAFSVPVGATCDSTNAAATPSQGTTNCSSTGAGGGNTDLGVSFPIGKPGLYRLCFEGGWTVQVTGGNWQGGFALVETPANAQTNTVVGDPLGYQIGTGTEEVGFLLRVCSTFDWRSATSGTIKTVRVMYADTLSSVGQDIIICDAASQYAARKCIWTGEQM